MRRRTGERRTFGERRQSRDRPGSGFTSDARGLPGDLSNGGSLGGYGGHHMSGQGYNAAVLSDDDIRARIYEALGRHPQVGESARILVDVADRAVTLSGTVPRDATKRAAWDAVWSVPGVRRVDNKVSVE